MRSYLTENTLVSPSETNLLMLFRETTAVYCENRTKQINTLCGQDVHTAKPGDTLSQMIMEIQ
jgi:thioredoxin-related protein